jgi:hypothetical protein
MMSIFAGQVQLVYASGKSPYESGYDHGCDDGGLSPSDRYINEPGKGPSFNTPEFMRGYNEGFNACGGGGSAGGGGGTPQGGGRIDWIQLCRAADPIIIPDCYNLVSPNNVLTPQGERAWGCIRNGLLLAGGAALLNQPLPVVIPILQALSEPTGCGGIVEWNFIGNVGNLRGIIDVLT